jgi:hypothetical protein
LISFACPLLCRFSDADLLTLHRFLISLVVFEKRQWRKSREFWFGFSAGSVYGDIKNWGWFE